MIASVLGANVKKASKTSEVDSSEIFAPAAEKLPLKCVNLNPAFASLVGRAPPTAMSVPSMMSPFEKRFLYGLARDYYKGEGVIIDGGIFLGASTRCFGDGLRENPNLARARSVKDKPIISFEKGSTNPGMIPFFQRHGVPISPQLHDSFLPVVQDYLGPVEDIVDLRVGDIMETAEDLDFPIEICFLDVLKLPEICSYCFQKFFPRLIPGLSIVIQQDYFYELLPYIKTHQEFLRDHFTFIGEIGSTAAYLCTSAIPAEKLEALRAGLPYEEQLRLSSIAMQRTIDPARRFMMALSKLRLIEKAEGRAEALSYLRMIVSDFPEQAGDTLHKRLSDSLRAVKKLLGDVS